MRESFCRKQAASIGEESAQISLDAIHIAAATLFNKVDQPEAAIAILEVCGGVRGGYRCVDKSGPSLMYCLKLFV